MPKSEALLPPKDKCPVCGDQGCTHCRLDLANKWITELVGSLAGILDIGKRDMSNPKYNGYFDEAHRVLGLPR